MTCSIHWNTIWQRTKQLHGRNWAKFLKCHFKSIKLSNLVFWPFSSKWRQHSGQRYIVSVGIYLKCRYLTKTHKHYSGTHNHNYSFPQTTYLFHLLLSEIIYNNKHSQYQYHIYPQHRPNSHKVDGATMEDLYWMHVQMNWMSWGAWIPLIKAIL